MSVIHDALKKLEKEKSREGLGGLSTGSPAPFFKPQSSDLHIKSLLNRILAGIPTDISFLLRKNLLGLDIGSSSIKAVKLKSSGSGYSLSDAGYMQLSADASEAETEKALKKLIGEHRWEKERIAASISNRSLTFTHLKLPQMPESDLKEAVRWEVKKGIDFSGDALIDYVINDEVVEDGRTNLSILSFAARKDEVTGLADMLKRARLVPGAVDVGPMALLSAFDYNYGWETDKRVAILDIGASKSTLAIVSGGTLRFARYIPLGGTDITRYIEEAEGIDFQAAEEKKLRHLSVSDEDSETVRSSIEIFFEGLTTELSRSFNYYQAHLREGRIDSLLITGGCSMIRGLTDSMESSLGIPASGYDVTRRLEIKADIGGPGFEGMAPFLVEAFGLALRKEGE